ncbi:MAG: hypothetical protein AAGA77_01360 [Bacteroidota bacterium]
MRIYATLYLVLMSPVIGLGQDAFFLDSLFAIDFSQVSDVQQKLNQSDIKRLKSDWGIEAGLRISNNNLDEIDAGLTSRVFLRSNLFANGLYSNGKDIEILQHEMRLDSLQGHEKAISNNYGIYYNYIIQEYNRLKIETSDSILVAAKELQYYLRQLYYNKYIDYAELIDINSTIRQYQELRKTHTTFNELSQTLATQKYLPALPIEQSWQVDFDGLFETLEGDSTINEVVLLQQEVLDYQYDKENAPKLSLSLGYDLGRKRPFYGVSFSHRIRTNKKSHLEAKKEKVENDGRLYRLQQKKEILNLQYEYEYKEKQIMALNAKLLKVQEENRKFLVKKDLLSLNEGKRERMNAMQYFQIQYEIVDLRQQQMLLLLQVKKTMRCIMIGPFLRPTNHSNYDRKFAGNRFLPLDPMHTPNPADQHFLIQNEIQIIHPSQVFEIENAQIIRPEEFGNRQEMEAYILTIIESEGIENIILYDLEQLKLLELKTLNQSHFDLSLLTEK